MTASEKHVELERPAQRRRGKSATRHTTKIADPWTPPKRREPGQRGRRTRGF